MKNVAGYGVGRLLCGSRGGLAVIVEASLKLLPQPPARAALVHALDADAIADPKRWEHVARREPTVLTVVGRALASRNPVLASDAPFALVAGFEDDAAWVEAQCAFTRERLGPPRLRVSDASVPPLWQMLADLEEMPGPRLTFASAHVSPTALAPLLRRPFAERLLFHSPHGRLTIWPAPDEASALVAELAGHGFACIEARGLDDLGPGGRQPAVLALRQRVRGALDPSGTMAYGSRWASGA